MRKIFTMTLITVFLLIISVISVNAVSYKKGDVDGNGSITVKDASLVQRFIIGLDFLNDEQYNCADVDNNGRVNLVDASRIQRYCIGYIDEIPDVSSDNTDNSSESDSDNTLDNDPYLAEVVRLVNIERDKVGVSPLIMDSKLNGAAAIRAEETSALFSHTRPNGSQWYEILSDKNISYSACAENIAAGYQTPEIVVENWMKSAGHRSNILSPKYSKIGVGHYIADDVYGDYWTQLFTD